MKFSQDMKTVEEEELQGRKKRKRNGSSPGLGEEAIIGRKTRSRGQKGSDNQPLRPLQILDSEEDDIYEPGM